MSEDIVDRPIEQAPVLITGLSGAGLSSAARVMEDMGWYVVQNLPSPMMCDLVELCQNQAAPITKVAFVTDVRSREFAGTIPEVMDQMKQRYGNPTLVFLDARDDVLIRRFDSVRRVHPLQGNATLNIGIARERQVLAPIKEKADIVLDTSDLSVHDLRRAMENSFATLANKRQHITIQSFGFKHGAPPDADLIVDVRFLPNPYWIPELRMFRGTDRPVAEYVLSQDAAEPFITNFITMLQGMTDGYRQEGKSFITVGVGCTGGHHRSVAVAEEIAHRLQGIDGLDVSIDHRDIGRD